MEEKDAQRIFEPFTRLHNRDKFDGTGIGLAICRTGCERHGWYIDVESAVGEGTKFIVRIPSAPKANE
jgi:signal transduction histidine kinase